MSRSTHWLLLSVFLAAMACDATAEANAPPLPAVVTSLVQNLAAKGGGELTFFGMSVYSAYFHCVDRSRCSWSPELPFALQLVYHRSLVGAMIAPSVASGKSPSSATARRINARDGAR